jgi:mono/diheme cytochrome c family protein
MTSTRLFAAALAAAVLSLAVPALAQDAPQGASKGGNVENGKKVFFAKGCFECHGRAGQGGAFNTPAPTLAKTMLPSEGLKGYVRGPTGDMPAYTEKLLPDQEVADIYAYLQSLPGPRKDVIGMMSD